MYVDFTLILFNKLCLDTLIWLYIVIESIYFISRYIIENLCFTIFEFTAEVIYLFTRVCTVCKYMFILSAIECDIKILFNCVITIVNLVWNLACHASLVPFGERPWGSGDLHCRYHGWTVCFRLSWIICWLEPISSHRCRGCLSTL